MKWYVKEFSKLTKVSVRTLHHYDDINLLKPSLRSSGNYRLYSEADLLKLERIVALKFFGFSLKQIKVLVGKDADVVNHLKAQLAFLGAQMQHLHQAIEAINELTSQAAAGKVLAWSKIVSLIEVYTMTKEISKTWAGQMYSSDNQVYSSDQLKQFAQIQQRYSQQEMADYGKRWEKLIDTVKKNLDQDPHSALGQQLAKEWVNLVDEIYGDFPDLKGAMSMAYKHNKISNAPFNQKLWDFMEKAIKYMENKK